TDCDFFAAQTGYRRSIGESPPPERENPVRLERRRTPRYAFSATTEITDEKENARTSSRVCDLSMQGCYLEMPNPFPEGTPVTVEIYKDAEFLEAHAIVAFREPSEGMGVRFEELQPYFASVLNNWVKAAKNGKSKAPN